MLRTAALIFGIGVLGGLGCGDSGDTGGTGGVGGTGAGPTTGGASAGGAGGSLVGGAGGTANSGGQGGDTAMCDAPFLPVTQDAGPFNGAFLYFAQDSLGAPVDSLTFEIYDGTPIVGDLEITDADYSSCVHCVFIYLGCDDNLANCQKTFMAQAGALAVTASGGSGSMFQGTLQGATFVEVELMNGQSTVVPNGQTFCREDYSFDAVVQ